MSSGPVYTMHMIGQNVMFILETDFSVFCFTNTEIFQHNF